MHMHKVNAHAHMYFFYNHFSHYIQLAVGHSNVVLTYFVILLTFQCTLQVLAQILIKQSVFISSMY